MALPRDRPLARGRGGSTDPNIRTSTSTWTGRESEGRAGPSHQSLPVFQAHQGPDKGGVHGHQQPGRHQAADAVLQEARHRQQPQAGRPGAPESHHKDGG